MRVAIQSGLTLASRAPVEAAHSTAYQIKAKPVPSEFKLSNGGSLHVCNPRGFAALRDLAGIDHDSFFASLTREDLLGGGIQESGKSGAMFWSSRDGRFVLKTVAEEELQKLLSFLPSYARYLMEHPDSLLTRYFGAYQLAPSRGASVVCIVVMNNVLEGARYHELYDLKGTSEDRWVDEVDGKCLKDTNFGPVTIYCAAETNETLHAVLQSDTQFLQRLHVMDYSLILSIQYLDKDMSGAFHPKPLSRLMGGLKGTVQFDNRRSKEPESCIFHIGLVDTLTSYDFKKQIAHTLKSNTIAHFYDIDTVPPDEYAERFRSYFQCKILAETETLESFLNVDTLKRAEPNLTDLLSFDSPLPAPASSATPSKSMPVVENLLDLDVIGGATCLSSPPIGPGSPMNFDPFSFEVVGNSAKDLHAQPVQGGYGSSFASSDLLA